jgi:hypothetical protein
MNDDSAKLFFGALFGALAIGMALAVGAMLIPVVLIIGTVWIGFQLYGRYQDRPKATITIHRQVTEALVSAHFPTKDEFVDKYLDHLIDALEGTSPAYCIYLTMAQVAAYLYDIENLNDVPAPRLVMGGDVLEEARYRDRLLQHQRKIEDPKRTLDAIFRTLDDCFLTLTRNLPPMARTARLVEPQPGGSAVQLIDVLPHAGAIVRSITAPFFQDDIVDLGLFASLRTQLERNLHRASDVEYSSVSRYSKKLTFPDEAKGTPVQIVSDYLKDTPLIDLFADQIPFSFTDEKRFEHTHVVGGSGHGKTQLLQHLIVNDLRRDDPPGLIIIDSQGEMLNKIQRLDLFAPGNALADRLIIIDPEDTQYPPALNMFDVKTARTGAHAEQLEATTISLFNYIFSSIAAELTSRQNTTFSYVTRLMLSIDGATIHTLLELFEDDARKLEGSPFAEKIQALDPTTQSYFRNQFFTSSYSTTKQSVARRLYGVLQVPAFERMFASKTNKLDMFDAMQSGKIVLVNTSRLLLQENASCLLGRYFIALALKAAYDRVTIPDRQRHPAFLIVDEAAEYFDDNIEELLNKARKSKLGVLVAHQNLQQKNMTPGLRAAIASCTTIKLAGGVSDSDARSVAHDMHTDATFIDSMKKRAHSTDFACYVRNYTDNAVRLTIPFGTLEDAPTMTAAERDVVIARNRRHYAAGREHPVPPLTGTGAAPSSTPPAGPGEPLVNLHHSDLPCKLEKDEPKSKEPTGTDAGDSSTDPSTKW